MFSQDDLEKDKSSQVKSESTGQVDISQIISGQG